MSAESAVKEPPRIRHGLALVAVILSTAGASVAFGIQCPLLIVNLERQGIGALPIGLLIGAWSLPIVLGGPLYDRLARRHGSRLGAIVGMGVSAAVLVLFPFMREYRVWLALQLLAGLGYGMSWVVKEAWINLLTTDAWRGRVTALYSVVPSAGALVGTLLTRLTGFDGAVPFIVAASGMALGALMLAVVPNIEADGQRLAKGEPARSSDALRAALVGCPTIFVIAFLSGVFETVPWGMLPVYALETSVSPQRGATLLSFFFLGQLLFAVPIGWLIDRFSPIRVSVMTSAFACAGALILPSVVADPWLGPLLILLWSPAVNSFYSNGLALMGFCYRGEGLVSANILFVMLYNIGAGFGPLTVGYAMERFGPSGFTTMLAIGAVVAIFAFVFTRVAAPSTAPVGSPRSVRDSV